MYFIVSTNTKKHTSRIVGHCEELEEAIELVKECAKQYVICKSDSVLHRKAGDGQVKFTDRVHYYDEPCPEHVHQIDVFRQQTIKDKGIVFTGYKEDVLLMRRFSYVKYDELVVKVTAQEDNEDGDEDSDELRAIRRARAQAMGLHHANTVGGFPPNVLQNLIDSDMYKQHRRNADSNKLPPPFQHTVFSDSEGDEETE